MSSQRRSLPRVQGQLWGFFGGAPVRVYGTSVLFGLGVDEVPVVDFDAGAAADTVALVLVDVLFDASQG